MRKAADDTLDQLVETLVDNFSEDDLLELVVRLEEAVNTTRFTQALHDCAENALYLRRNRVHDVAAGDIVQVQPDHWFRNMVGCVKGVRGDRAVVTLAYKNDEPFDAIVPCEYLTVIDHAGGRRSENNLEMSDA